MIGVLLLVICLLLAGIWWDLGANARAARRLLLAASDLNAEKHDATERRLERIESRLPRDDR